MEEEKLTLKEESLYRMAAQQLEAEDFDENEAWRKMEGKIGRQSRRPVLQNFFKYAAVLVVLAITGVTLWYYAGKREEQWCMGDPGSAIIPGSSKAELILATGERIVITPQAQVVELEQPGVRVMVDTVAGLVEYVNDRQSGETEVFYNTLSVPKGGEFMLTLSDGTRVWLNSESSLKFPVRFQEKRREVYLEGEAFFQVKPDKAAPFHVHAGGDDIRVLGTGFNVSVYNGDPFLHTTLVEGSVAINHNGKEFYLNPSEQYRLDRTNQHIEVKKVETRLYTSWRDGKMYFKGLRLEDIVRQLERWYDFRIFYENDEVKEMKFRGAINKYASFDTVLKILEQTTDIRFDIRGNTVIARKIKERK